MDENEIEKRLSIVEENIKKINESLDGLSEENDILKKEFANSAIERARLKRAQEKFYNDEVNKVDEYEKAMEEKFSEMQSIVEKANKKCEELRRENNILVSENKNGLLKEIINQAKEEKEEMGNNPFDI